MKKKLNLEKMRNQRHRENPRYIVQYINRDDLIDLNDDAIDWIIRQMVEPFAEKTRLRHFWSKKPFRIDVHQDVDIDHNRVRIIVEERW